MDFLLQRGQGEVLHHAFQFGDISRPRMVAQRI